jgi:hypothetical protein
LGNILWSAVGKKWWIVCKLNPAKNTKDGIPVILGLTSLVDATVCYPKSHILGFPSVQS